MPARVAMVVWGVGEWPLGCLGRPIRLHVCLLRLPEATDCVKWPAIHEFSFFVSSSCASAYICLICMRSLLPLPVPPLLLVLVQYTIG